MLKKLNKPQLARKAEEARPLLEPYAAESVRAILQHLGVWQRLVGAGYALDPDASASPLTERDLENLTPGEQRRAVLEGLFSKARGGDPSAARAFHEIMQRTETADVIGNVLVEIVPFDVPDRVGEGRSAGVVE
jgi:hypothetical protein